MLGRNNVGIPMLSETGVLATMLTPTTSDGKINGTWRGGAEIGLTSALSRIPSVTVRHAGRGDPVARGYAQWRAIASLSGAAKARQEASS